ncbi:MAG: SGNH/GDSL hydrolase family protein [Cytophagia bacterium]|nr:MAG: SGNH/GDSL hydrolase family protein [Cytophagia bacterium]TAG39549.1 MAG: SGNH/GDSL hydrolase family protein [Cytophagia bacterium]
MDKRRYMIKYVLFLFLCVFYWSNQNNKLIINDLYTYKKDSLQLKNLHASPIKNYIEKKINANKKIKIICFGNSITNGYKVGKNTTVVNSYPLVLQKLLQKKYKNDSILVIKEGKNGRRIDQALLYLPQIIAQKPDVVIIELGINDAYSNFSSDFFNEKMAIIVQKLKQKKIEIIIASPTPILMPYNTKVWEITKGLYQFCKENKISFVNLYEKVSQLAQQKNLTMQKILPDNIHFADEYYAYLSAIIFDYLYEN